MSELEKILGKELMKEIQIKLNGKKITIDNGKMIPKHRFDEINESLKRSKQELEEIKSKLQNCLLIESELKDLRKENIILNELAKYKIKSINIVRPLIKLDGIEESNLKQKIKTQINKLKKTEPYLFCEENKFLLVPYNEKTKTEN